jgi:hypothetical protein
MRSEMNIRMGVHLGNSYRICLSGIPHSSNYCSFGRSHSSHDEQHQRCSTPVAVA